MRTAQSVNKVISLLSAMIIMALATSTAYADYYTSAEPDTLSYPGAQATHGSPRYHCTLVKPHHVKHRSHCRHRSYSKHSSASISIYCLARLLIVWLP